MSGFFLAIESSRESLAGSAIMKYLSHMSEFSRTRSVARPILNSMAARRRRAALQRALPLIVLALGVVGMPALLLSSGGLQRLERLKAERETVKLEISRLSKRIEQLRSGSQAAKSEPAAVERSARDELGLIRRTEIVFHFEPNAE